jgi:hypothetical protein
MSMKLTEIRVYVDQNLAVQEGNRYNTMRVGLGLTAEVTEAELESGARKLHAMAEAELNKMVEPARASAQARLNDAPRDLEDEEKYI